jgi:hypothetical protein
MRMPSVSPALFQSTKCGQPGLEGVERLARFNGIFLNLAGDLVKE